jgi:hypothetical protein
MTMLEMCRVLGTVETTIQGRFYKHGPRGGLSSQKVRAERAFLKAGGVALRETSPDGRSRWTSASRSEASDFNPAYMDAMLKYGLLHRVPSTHEELFQHEDFESAA